MGRVLHNVIAILILLAVAYVFRAPLFVLWHQAMRVAAPCAFPIPYAIGTIDSRFGLSEEEVTKAAEAAIAIWETNAGKDLFVRTNSGNPVVTLNFEYDLRQETTETLKDLGKDIAQNTAQYEALEAEYTAVRERFLSAKASFQTRVSAFEADAASYERDVDSWNARGGAPRNEVQKLNQEKASLQERQQQITAEQHAVNALADEVNSYANRLNAIAHDVNNTARTYNRVGEQTGEEFEEGVYQSAAGHESITVFEFDSMDRLVRLLAHEFGHALGMDHVANEDSLLYRLNQGANLAPTDEDTAELKRVCRMN